jgi:hypothetical protein
MIIRMIDYVLYNLMEVCLIREKLELSSRLQLYPALLKAKLLSNFFKKIEQMNDYVMFL